MLPVHPRKVRLVSEYITKYRARASKQATASLRLADMIRLENIQGKGMVCITTEEEFLPRGGNLGTYQSWTFLPYKQHSEYIKTVDVECA